MFGYNYEHFDLKRAFDYNPTPNSTESREKDNPLNNDMVQIIKHLPEQVQRGQIPAGIVFPLINLD